MGVASHNKMDDTAKLNNAVRSGSIEKVEELLDSELKEKDIPKILNQEGKGASPLMVACQLSNIDESQKMIRFLVNRGADVNFQSILGRAISRRYSIDIIRCLLELKAKLDDDQLHIVCMIDDVALAALLLANGAKVNEASMMAACKKGNFKMVELLLANGAEVNVVGKPNDGEEYDGKSPLLIAMKNGHSDIVKLLLSKGAKIIDKIIKLSINPRRQQWLGPDPYPARNPYSIEVSKVLFENEVDYLSAVTSERESPLLIYTTTGQTELVKMCLDRGDDVNEADNYGIYPLWRAVERKDYNIFELLMKKDANATMRPNNKQSALEMLQDDSSLLTSAIESKNYELVEFLLSNRAHADHHCSSLLWQDNASLLVSSL